MATPRHFAAMLMVVCSVFLAACSQPHEQKAADQPPLVTGLPDFTKLVEKEGPAVVNISTVSHIDASEQQKQQEQLRQQLPEFFRRFFDQFGDQGQPSQPQDREMRSLGSGFIISKDGYVLTNNHVVDGADEIMVRLQDRRELKAKVVGADKQSDLALLKVDADDLPVVDIGSSEKLKVGEWVLAIGAPFGFDSSVTAGIVSAKGRNLPTDNYVPFIQTDVAINPGNSGGPLFNMKGQVVGINSQIVSRSGGYMGLSFAIPMDMAMDVVKQLKENGKVSHGWLGVLIQDVDHDLADSFGLDKPMGALVSQVSPDSPAKKAGVQPGDVIVAYDGEEIQRSSDLPKLVGRTKPDSSVKMEVVRNGKHKTLDVTIGLLPDDPRLAMMGGDKAASGQALGLTVRAASASELANQNLDNGVVVTGVDDGPAQDIGIQEGDVLVSLNNQPLKDADGFAKVVSNLPDKGTVAVLVSRDGNARFLALKLK
ncbi:alginate biosynthesis negative regulator, serine protease [Alcanivorax hongdengensis A-11-3]|uniref:Probable periplasmic serine endoprotease DegP-like n=1 Tax=Alcanivorax hongdengensis A-11-3 TaxID=1177179 RepID=L0WDS7_9GAMM|nr:DegQ family serine endoprotease [Alcanivorax hongdengensis]EKF73940.1 alginate biosynthesis negative regulator, serine protease [Alcanivorax hongdengensis A-11-3]